jgi:hypothetical protein
VYEYLKRWRLAKKKDKKELSALETGVNGLIAAGISDYLGVS